MFFTCNEAFKHPGAFQFVYMPLAINITDWRGPSSKARCGQ